MRKKHWVLPVFLAFSLFLGLNRAEAKDVNWAGINPDLEGATFVKNSAECLRCHADYMKSYESTVHARIFKHNPRNDNEALDCETCHGPMSKHIDAPRNKPPFAVSFKTIDNAQKNMICEQCHKGGMQIGWKGSKHQAAGVACISCHYVMERRSDDSLFVAENASQACVSCHIEKKGQIQKSAHMPVKEGKMGCESCHNPHGSGNAKMLKAGSINDTCYTCHAEKRGPFIWEHAPVRENCTNCHDPHGSNNSGMLVAKGPFLCTNCHQYGGHVDLPRYNRASSPYGQGCINCHSRVHGSNHPSGAKFTR